MIANLTAYSELGIEPTALMLTILPHAVPELVALFLPLAAWIIASRAGEEYARRMTDHHGSRSSTPAACFTATSARATCV